MISKSTADKGTERVLTCSAVAGVITSNICQIIFIFLIHHERMPIHLSPLLKQNNSTVYLTKWVSGRCLLLLQHQSPNLGNAPTLLCSWIHQGVRKKPTTIRGGEKGFSSKKMLQEPRASCVVITSARKFKLIRERCKIKKINWSTVQKHTSE